MNGYDFVLIDCPPSLGQLTQTALAASSEVLMPIQCEYFAMEGLTQMIDVIRDVMQQENTRLEFGGILLTMYDHMLEVTHEVEPRCATSLARSCTTRSCHATWPCARRPAMAARCSITPLARAGHGRISNCAGRCLKPQRKRGL